MDNLGPHCDAAGITVKHVESCDTVPKVNNLSNGVVLELFQFSKKSGHILNQFCRLLESFDSNLKCVNSSTVTSRVNSILDKKKKNLWQKRK